MVDVHLAIVLLALAASGAQADGFWYSDGRTAIGIQIGPPVWGPPAPVCGPVWGPPPAVWGPPAPVCGLPVWAPPVCGPPVCGPVWGPPPVIWGPPAPVYDGGLGFVYDEAYQRRLRQLENERRWQAEEAARQAGRRAAEWQFYGGW